MTRDEIETRAREVVVDELQVTPEQVTASTRFAADLGCDDLTGIGLIIELELEFDVELPDEVAEGCRTFGQAVDALAAALKVAA